MRIRAVNTANLDADTVAAFCRYHGIDMKTAKRREIAAHIRATLEQVGSMGFGEQCHEGAMWLEHEAAGENFATFRLEKGVDE